MLEEGRTHSAILYNFAVGTVARLGVGRLLTTPRSRGVVVLTLCAGTCHCHDAQARRVALCTTTRGTGRARADRRQGHTAVLQDAFVQSGRKALTGPRGGE